ncbi:MAG: hypothetical protein IKO74_05120, partial [Selenomonadaceae bacterium]|nr:hypothetical protein [Selenomonadaceae bacterium]
MNDFVFDLQRFATTEIKKDNSTTIDGVTYTAVEDAVLNLDSNNKVSGIASGSVTATLEGNSAVQVTFDGNKAFDFSCSADDDALAVTMQGKSIRFTAGAINCSAEGVSASGEVSLKGFIAKVFPFNLKLDIPDAGLNITFDGETKITAPEKVNVTLTFPESIAKAIAQFSFVFTLLGVDTQTAQRIYNVLRKLVSSPTTAGLEGTFSWNQDDKKLTINQDSNLALNIIDYDLNMAAKNGSVDGMSFFAKFTQELGAFGAKFTPGTDENAVLNLKLDKNGSQILEGALNITAGSINIDIFNGNITFEKDTTFTLMQDNNEELNFKFSDGATITYSADEEGILYLSFDGNSGTMDLTKIKRTEYYTTSALVNLGVNGTLKVDTENETIIVTKDTTTTIYFGGYAYTVKAVGDAEINITLKNDNFIFTTKDGTGTLGLNVKRANETTFDGNLEINGSIEIDPISHKLNLSKDSSISLTHPNNINARTFLLTAANDDSFDLTIKAVDDAGLSSSIEQNGTTWTTATDGNLFTITIKRGGQTLLDGYLKIKGTFILDNNGDLILAKDTELQIDFGDDYIVNLKATEADSKIFIGNDEITFASDSEIGGGLELSVTRGDDSRSASLDVKGSVTYKLDGTISLTKGTEIKNVFEDGNILTITANTDTQDSIVFTPEDGLTIKPGSADTLTALFTVDNLNVIKVTSLEGSINYKEGLITAADGTKISMTNYESKGTIWTVEGGTLTVAYDDERAVYTVSKGTSVLVDWSYGKTWEFQSGSITDIYDGTEILSAGASFKGNDDTKKFTLEKAGKYTINGIDITTSSDNVEVRLPDYDTVSIGAKEGITVSATEDKAFRFKFGLSGTINVTTTGGGDFGISNGSVTFDEGKISIDKGTTVSLTAGEQVSAFTTNEDISAPYKIEEDIYYLTLDKASAGVCVTQDEQTVLAGKMEIDGVFSYRPETGTYGLTGAKNTSLQFTDENGLGIKMATNDTTIVFVPKYSDGKFEVNFPNENKNAMAFTVSKDGQTTFENNVVINGTVGFDTANQELSLTKETVLTLTQGENVMTITATDDAGGKLTAVEGGLRFAPNENDGALELNFVSANRKANIDVTGAIDFGEGGKISLEAGTEVNFTWEDGTKLKLTSKGSTGSISLDEKGIKITSEDEKLSIDLTTATGDQTHLSGIEGTIYYNAGTVSFDDNSKITATTTLGGESILMTLETQGGTGHLDFAKNGVIYSADSGAMKITWSKDDLESTFTVLSGSVQIGHGLFQIAEGTELSTDLKNFVPALYFTTQKAGSYTINGQKIETTAENIPMTATDDYMTFKTSDDVVKYDGMTFAGEGNVSLTSGGVVLGAGVEASGFEKDKSFILAQEGTVTADERIFELTEDVPTGISVKGAQDGFIFSRTITEESEARFENPNSEDIGKIFTEEFFLENDDAYRIQTDLLGLQKIIGVTAPSTLNATATFDGEPEETLFDLVTDNEGVFTVGKKDYSISGDSSVAIKADFEPDKSYVRGFDDLSGTVSGDFTSHVVSINGSSSAVQPVDDTLISIAADENGFEIFGLDKDASLKVAAKDSYKVNETSINTNAQDFIVGNGSNSAYLLAMNNNTIVTGTEGNDTIQNTGSNVTINAAQGNDQISLTSDARNNVIQYESGSGNDTIYGYNVMDLDFEDGESIVLTEAGAVTVEGKVFELTKKVPDGVTITGTQDGFTSSVTEDG